MAGSKVGRRISGACFIISQRGAFLGIDGAAQGVVAWDVEVTNQLGELVASYDILTLVLKKP